MSKLFSLGGNDDFYPGGSIYRNPKEASLFFSLGHHLDVYFPPSKRSRISAPAVFNSEYFEKEESSIEVLPDECLFEVFRRLDGDKERAASACVSKRWLMLLSNIRRDEICSNKTVCDLKQSGEDEDTQKYISCFLEGKKATDVGLAAVSVATASRGGLRKLLIRGSNPTRGVTRIGLRAIARGSPDLKVLSLSNVPTIGDEELLEIAGGCPSLEKIELCCCSMISDRGLTEIAKNCLRLTDLTVDSCANIGNEGLRAIGQNCPNLKSITVTNCPLVGDQAIAGLLSSASFSLSKVKLQALSITDVSLAVIGHYGLSVTDLILSGLQNVTEKGFWAMGNGHGLQKMSSLTVASCQGVTDIGLEAVGKGSPNLKSFCLRRCAYLSDRGLVSFAKAAVSLESLQLEECHRITQIGLFAVLSCGTKLNALALVSCSGIKDYSLRLPEFIPCQSLNSLTIRNCPGFGAASLALLGKSCPQLQNVDFSGLQGLTDSGLIPLLEDLEGCLVKVNLSGCVNLTDKAVSTIAELHGWTLEVLNLDGCRMISDASMAMVADNCMLLTDLNVSKCAISDFGLAALVEANLLNLQILTVSGCSLISDRSVPLLVNLGLSLKNLNVQQCKGFSCSGIHLLMKRLWNCDILA